MEMISSRFGGGSCLGSAPSLHGWNQTGVAVCQHFDAWISGAQFFIALGYGHSELLFVPGTRSVG